ncbi:MAG TPA: hypothetical protein VGJ28_27615, partial [Micromonosporaceae bacterium]
MQTRTLRRIAPVVVVAALAMSGCGGPAKAKAVAVATHSPAPVASASPSPSLVPKPVAPHKGPPPKKGTLAWYVYELPQFSPAPVPTKVETLPVSGPAKQVNRVDVG